MFATIYYVILKKFFFMFPSSYFSDKVIKSSYTQRDLMHSHFLKVWVKVQGEISNLSYKYKSVITLYYIENYSIWLDIKLMLLTVKILFTPDSTEGVDENQITAQKKN